VTQDVVRLSELLVLRLLDVAGGAVPTAQLRTSLRNTLVHGANTYPFTIGAHQTLRDFLIELDASGAVTFFVDHDEPRVELTDHGRAWLDDANKKGFGAYLFG
jgi:hypothetical protein